MNRLSFKPRATAAFTLVEVMVSLALFAMIVAAIYGAWILILKSDAMAQKVAARAQRERIAIHTIEDALICSESFQASLKYYSFIVDNGEESSSLSFTARVPEMFPRNGKFGDADLRRLNFTVEDAGSDQPGKNLVLRQNSILTEMDDTEKQFPLILAQGVKSFTVDCWDTNKEDWVQQWDNTNSIPPLVRVKLVLAGDLTASDAAALTVTRLVAMPSAMMPARVQVPNGGPPGGGLAPPSIPTR